LGNPSAQIEYTKKSKKWIMPASNYSINVKTNDGQTNLMHILAIDTIFLCGNSGYDHNKEYYSNWDDLNHDKDPFTDLENHLKYVSTQNFTYIVRFFEI
jgi:hypothetical protein